MATPPDSNQILRVPGELQIDSSAGYKTSSGLISFIGQFNQKLGQIRAYGYGAFNSLLVDGSDCGSGIQFRSNKTQGDSLIDGQSDQFPLRIETNTTKARFLKVGEDQTAFYNQHNAATLLEVTRANTNNTTVLTNTLARFNQIQMKAGETFQVELGPSSFGGTSLWSWTQGSSTSSSATDNYASLKMMRSGTMYENIRLLPNGNVSIPNHVDVGTVNATTYLNLPPVVVPASELVPITLDKTNNRVGINKTTPTEALDVTGNALVSGTLTADTVSATTYLNLPVADVLPLTLDKTNNRVGVNNTSPSSDLDVTGSASVSGTLTANTLSATTYVGLPPVVVPASELTPITLDKTNNRIGINNTSPNEAFDVIGNAKVSGLVTTDTISGPGGTASSTLKLSGKLAMNRNDAAYTLDIWGNARISDILVVSNGLTVSNWINVFQGATFYSWANVGSWLNVSGNATFLSSASVAGTLSVNSTSIISGTGTPEGSVTSPVGSLFLRKNGDAGTCLYVKESGTGFTGWSTVQTATSGPTKVASILGSNVSFNTTPVELFNVNLPYAGYWQVTMQLDCNAGTTACITVNTTSSSVSDTPNLLKRYNDNHLIWLYSASTSGNRSVSIYETVSGSYTAVATTTRVVFSYLGPL